MSNTASEYARLPHCSSSRYAREPTPRQLAVLRVIADSLRERGVPPTWREIGEATGVASTNGVADHLKALERKGLVTWPIGTRRDHVQRMLRITEAGKQALGMEPGTCLWCGRTG